MKINKRCPKCKLRELGDDGYCRDCNDYTGKNPKETDLK